VSDDLKFQLRLTLSDEFAQAARNNPGDASISALADILSRHDAVMKCQFDAFADYVSEADHSGQKAARLICLQDGGRGQAGRRKGLAGHRERDLGNAACDSSMTGGSFPLGAPMPPSSVASSRNNAGAGRSAMDVDLCQELAAGVTSTSSWPELPNSCRM